MSIMHNGEKVLNNLTTVPITQTINASSTDTQVPSAKAVNDTTSKFLKTYTSIEQLGLTNGSETIEDIANSMEGFTRLIAVIERPNISIYPHYNGTLIVEKLNPYRVHFKFCVDESPMVYVGTYHALSGFTGWQRLCTTSVADVSQTMISSEESSITGTMAYAVKNGICYVTIWGVSGTTVGNDYIVCSSMPRCGMASGSLLCAAGTDGANVAFGHVQGGETSLKINIFKTGIVFFGSFSYQVV